MKRQKVILLDQAQIGTILKYGGFEALDAIVGRGDKFLYVHQAYDGDQDFRKIGKHERKPFENWLTEQRYKGRVEDVDKIDLASGKEQKRYDPLKKAGSRRNNKELWDMGARKFMMENKDLYDFEVISADQTFLDNRVGRNHPLKRIPFKRISMKSAMTWLLSHPDVNLTEERFYDIKSTVEAGGFGESNYLEKNVPNVPESYSRSQDFRVANRFNTLFRGGGSAAVIGIAAIPVFSMVEARASEKEISFTQAASELGVDFSEEELKSFASEVGVDLAVSFTPVGLVKRAWDILGNIDDIVAVTQLYGTAYPDNETIQKLAEIGDSVENSEFFEAYVEGRDALTGAVGDVIDFVFSESADEETALEGLGKIHSALEPQTGDLARVLSPDATRSQIADVLKSVTGGPVGTRTVPLSNFPLIPGAQPILSPEFVPSLKVMPSAENSRGSETRPSITPHPKPGPDLLNPVSDPNAGPVKRKTSYDRHRKLGRTPEEEALAFDDYHHHLRESFAAMDGDMEAAHLLAVRQFHRDWDVSVFAPDEEGTVMKNPVERVYPALANQGHDYVRKDVDTLLAGQGIKAAKWYLSPNEKTGSDWRQGATDEDGYGPRMTLVYDDEAGGRHHVTDSFQANVWGASKQKVAQKGQTSEPVELDVNGLIPDAKPVPVSSPPIPMPKPHQTG